MTVAQLLALQPGQQLRWDLGAGPEMGGVVAATGRELVTILWDDGQVCTAGGDDEDDCLSEFAGSLRAIGGRPADPDEPVILPQVEVTRK
jgi:hypothetical protein